MSAEAHRAFPNKRPLAFGVDMSGLRAADVAGTLKGRRLAGGFICRCPVPSHGASRGDRNPSLSVKDGAQGLLFHCFAGCSAAEVMDALRQIGLRDRHQDAHGPTKIKAAQKPAGVDIWNSARPLVGSLAERYLTQHRRLSSPFPATLRFCPNLVYPPMGRALPALIAAVQSADRSVIAVQATFLRASDGSKASVSKPRWTFGTLDHGAVRLGPAADILGLAEGLEDALAAQSASGVTCWAALGAGRMANVFVPDIVRELHVFADDDDAGRRAVAEAVARHQRQGRVVVVRLPPIGCKDWGDYATSQSLRRVA